MRIKEKQATLLAEFLTGEKLVLVLGEPGQGLVGLFYYRSRACSSYRYELAFNYAEMAVSRDVFLSLKVSQFDNECKSDWGESLIDGGSKRHHGKSFMIYSDVVEHILSKLQPFEVFGDE